MSFHKHGVYSFTIAIQRMRPIAGDNFVADVTALRRHGPSGAAVPLEVPDIPEQYGDTAQQAQGRAITVMSEWLESRREAPPTAESLSRTVPAATPQSDTAPPRS